MRQLSIWSFISWLFAVGLKIVLQMGHSLRCQFEFWSEFKILPCFLHLFTESGLVRILSAARFNFVSPFDLFFPLFLNFDIVLVMERWLVVSALLIDPDSQVVSALLSSWSTSTDLSTKLKLHVLLEPSAFPAEPSGSLALHEGLKKLLIVIGGLRAFFSNRLFTGVESSIVAMLDLSVNIGIITGAIPNWRFMLFYNKKFLVINVFEQL